MSSQTTTGVLLVNLGTPNSPRVSDVRTYLRQFLMDGRVIDIPYLLRFLLVQGIIVPFRAPKSAKVYKELWTNEGSPLLIYGRKSEKLLQEALGKSFKVVLAMRYQQPSIESALKVLLKEPLKELIILPMFPQYASASTGSVQEAVMHELSKLQIIPQVHFVGNYFDHPQFIEAFYQVAKPYFESDTYDHYVFSYHGLPERQIKKGDSTGVCLSKDVDCCAHIHTGNYYCYRAQCFATTRALVERFHLRPDQYSTCFQSRLGRDPWIKPYTDDVLKSLAKNGKKKVLALVPSFVSDCLETTIEVGEEYKEAFEEAGGEHWQMVPSLNEHPAWIDCLKTLVFENSVLQKQNQL